MIAFNAQIDNIQYQILLRNPEFDDSLDIDFGMSEFTSMDGTLYTSLKPTKKTINLDFENITRSKIMELKSFLLSTMGNIITYTDILGVNTKVIIKNDLQVNTSKKGILGDFSSFTLELEVTNG